MQQPKLLTVAPKPPRSLQKILILFPKEGLSHYKPRKTKTLRRKRTVKENKLEDLSSEKPKEKERLEKLNKALI
jgi:hypothetical protein